MQTLMLCESVSRAQFKPFDPTTLTSLNSYSSSYSPSIKSKLSKLSPRTLPLCFSRCNSAAQTTGNPTSWYSAQQSQYANKDEELFGHPTESSSASIHGTELRFCNRNSSKATSKSIQIHQDFSHINKSTAEICIKNEDSMSTSSNQDTMQDSNSSCHRGLKLALLFGLLTFQGSQQAVAVSDFASGMQSIPYIGDLGDISTGFASAFLLIFFSELGDKTFFIAALLAARNSGLVVFIGTFGALAAMTIVSVILGRTFHYVDDILPFRFGGADLPVDDIAAVCLLVYFGVSTLLEASSGDGLKAEEEQKEAELAVSDFSGNGAGILAAANTVVSTFALVFVAEWGDKSFFSTIALAAASSPLGVVGGALAGHAVATLLAVVGGSLLGTFFSEKVIAYIGGSLFLVFAAVTLIEIFN